ncbi:MAG: AbrB/MazE/SpoVT family DNA-binding domain-containing protein [Gemmatimonadales bacterium]|nr:AbrB/MazE/SpoVT family DNA-binding domain-containing protein [Gemmatimonadales bacterium]MYG18286.1 AbrB/MazE/SpoVT family DNA-binding domain-containing protein [Gemmatimonadales bacterium]MYL07271.1 AbrB/MazE/SpoVT family DNA-binding domain-containing protein [Gemmatimonadales bacterium]
MVVSVKMSSKNQIVVPKAAREALGLAPGDRLAVSVDGETVMMEKLPPDDEDRLRGLLRDVVDAGGLWPELEEA